LKIITYVLVKIIKVVVVKLLYFQNNDNI